MRNAGRRDEDPELAEAVRKRLAEYLGKKFGENKSALARHIDVPRPTVMGWLNEQNPHLPTTVHLVAMANKTNLNLNWLLLGTRPSFRGELVHGGDIRILLRSALLADLGGEFGSAERVDAALPDGEALFVRLRDFCAEFVRRVG